MRTLSAAEAERRRRPSLIAPERHRARVAVSVLADVPEIASPSADRPPARHGGNASGERSLTSAEGPAAHAVAESRARDLRFVRRIYRLRTLGLALGVLCVASVLRLNQEPLGWWILLLAHGFAWPHAAALLATRSKDPRRTEIRNLMIDSALGGAWIAVMQFNLLPAVLLATMLSVDKVSAGGPALVARTSALLFGTCAATSALLGFPVNVTTPMSVIVASIPFLIVYPLAISGVTYSLANKLARQNQRLDELGRTDALTGLANRRQGVEMAETELARYRRTGRPVVLIVLDIDRFKNINDRYGHPAGDEVICAVAKTLRGCCRAVDVVARYGGDEFLLVFPETDMHGAGVAAKRIRRKLDAYAIENAPDLRCTLSFGAAEASVETTNVELWIRQADAALYRAKAAGRDCFVTAAGLDLS
jgi:diguanylate cyclase